MTDKQTVKFGDICKEVKLTTKDPIGDGYERYIGLEHLDSGSLKIKRWGMIAEDSPSFTRVFKKGQILFGKRRPYLKKAAIAEFDGICSGDIIVMEATSENQHPEFLEVLVHSTDFWDWAVKTSSGSLSPRTKFKSLAEYNFVLPDDEKLKGLVELKNGLEKVTRATEKLEESFEALSSVLINEMFNEAGENEVPLSHIASVEYGISSSIDKSLNKGVKMITLPCVEPQCYLSLDESKIAYTPEDEVSKEDYLKAGDILFNWRNGSPDHIGKSVYIEEDIDFTHVGFLLRVRLKEQNREMSQYLWLYLYWLKMNDYFRGSKGQVNKTFNKGELLKLPIKLPGRDELESITRNLSVIFNIRDKLIESNSTKVRLKENLLRI